MEFVSVKIITFILQRNIYSMYLLPRHMELLYGYFEQYSIQYIL